MAEQTHPPLGGVTPYLTVRGAKDAAEFYKRAFGAEELRRQEADDGKRLIHCHLRINGDDVMMSDEFPEYGFGLGDGPVGVTLHLTASYAIPSATAGRSALRSSASRPNSRMVPVREFGRHAGTTLAPQP